MLRMHVEIKGLDNTIRRLDRLDSGLQDASPFLRQAGTEVIASSQRNIEAGGRPAWEPLSDATLMLRRKGGEGARPLRDVGLLMASIGNPAKDGVWVLEKGAVTVGTALKYAAPQQFGATTGGMIPGKRIPARPFLKLQPYEEERIFDMAVRFVNRRIREARL